MKEKRENKKRERIIKLLKPGDYINGYRIVNIEGRIKNTIEFEAGWYGSSFIEFEEIKTIVLKEQFERMEYKLEDESI